MERITLNPAVSMHYRWWAQGDQDRAHHEANIMNDARDLGRDPWEPYQVNGEDLCNVLRLLDGTEGCDVPAAIRALETLIARTA